ncbi:MAG: hypothetical protein ACLFO1_09770 [Spirochaetaceae bacterium]
MTTDPRSDSGRDPALSDSFRMSDESGESIMRVSPALGCNVYSWTRDGTELLFTPPGFLQQPDVADGTAHLGGGNPVLFPAVGRTWDLEHSPPRPEVYRIAEHSGTFRMPVHGLAGLMRWERAANTPSTDSAALGEYRGRIPAAIRAEHYPFDVEVVLRYELRRNGVHLTAGMTNNSNAHAPFAFGLHPYFRVSDKEQVEVVLPCTSRVHLDDELLIPTGERDPLPEPVLRFDDGKTYDMAFGDVNGTSALIRNVGNGLDIRIDVDPAVSMFVVYSGSRTPFVCVEPWTRGLGAFATLRENATPSNPSIGFLSPGETRQMHLRYTVLSTSQRNGGNKP